MNKNEWISVEDKLPESGFTDGGVNEVLIQLNISHHSGTIKIGHYYQNLWWIEKDDGYRVVGDLGFYVSHWQPLPEMVRSDSMRVKETE